MSFISLLGGAVLLALVGSAGTAGASCASNPECNPYDPATLGCCDAGSCTWLATGANCEDGNDCTVQTKCNGQHECKNNAVYSTATYCRERTVGYLPINCKRGTCNTTAPFECVLTNVTDGCTDGNPCTTDCVDDTSATCIVPVNKPADSPCEGDASLCTHETCNGAGACGHVSDVVCPDSNPPQCKMDQCQAATGACIRVAVPNGPTPTACNPDNNECSKDICVDGSCAHPADIGKACNDFNECTTPDACNASKDCVGTPKAQGAACADDHNPCKWDVCAGDPIACTHSPLHPVTGENTQGMACNDGWSCSFGTTCDQGSCFGPGIFCDGSKPCLACQNSCNPTAPKPQCGCSQ